MEIKTQNDILAEIVEYFKVYIFENHITASINTHSKLKSYNINPIIVKYLSKVLENNYTAIGVAKALFYPRVLGTSINTSFGARIQNMFVDLKIAEGSLIKGMDIEFIDKIDNRRKWCQLKSEPNTINSEDVKPLIKKFTDTINLARTNKAFKNINNTDFMVGVLYGEVDELSMHYKVIDKTHPVIIGKEFWHRVTGFPDFYDGLVQNLQLLIENIDTQDLINLGVEKLSKEIESSQLFDFKE
ncbi:PmeII family type II restriction endonuclease [Chryseobacterium sp. CFS15]|uniref:PmeII family type II restriction endonuclease n=1 Tax=Chryseobacterium sp. CFS15 TaxID=2986946 RepID=UPI002809BC97|nr:PmeII family type II restriction endonuclease [Chryseobacterium sp. CFS15]MDQ8144128.1 PmeII family type II restriction endonuclease [Chryseobacterium sp. CFS15]